MYNRRQLAPPSRKTWNRFKAVPRWHNGEYHASTGELLRQYELQVLEDAKLIKDLQRQINIPMVVNGHLVQTWRIDWRYFDCQIRKHVIEDFKGAIMPDFKHKLKLFFACYHDSDLVVRISRRGKPHLDLSSFADIKKVKLS